MDSSRRALGLLRALAMERAEGDDCSMDGSKSKAKFQIWKWHTSEMAQLLGTLVPRPDGLCSIPVAHIEGGENRFPQVVL